MNKNTKLNKEFGLENVGNAQLLNTFSILRSGSHVKRYHTVRLIGEQTVSSHSWGVATILMLCFPDISKECLLAALHHDIPEALVGDMPATTKRLLAENGQPSLLEDCLKAVEKKVFEEYGLVDEHSLCEEDYFRLKTSDYLELMAFCLEQLELGNRTALKVFRAGSELVQENLTRLVLLNIPVHRAVALYEELFKKSLCFDGSQTQEVAQQSSTKPKYTVGG